MTTDQLLNELVEKGILRISATVDDWVVRWTRYEATKGITRRGSVIRDILVQIYFDERLDS